MRRILAVTAGLVLASVALAQPDPAATMRVDPPTVTVGEVFEATVEVRLPADHDAVISGEDADFGEAEVRGFSREQNGQADGSVLHTATWKLVLWEVGEKTLTAPALTVRGPDGEVVDIDRPEAPVTVRSVVPEGTEEIRDIRGPKEIPLRWFHYAIAALPVLGLLGLIALLVWWVRARKRQEPQEEMTAPPLPPAEAALAALRDLQAEDLPAEERFKEHYVKLSHILRNYIERRWGLPALEETTGMLRHTMLGSGRVSDEFAEQITEVLRRADLAKFAKYRTLPDIARADIVQVRDVVRATRPTQEVAEGAKAEAVASPAS